MSFVRFYALPLMLALLLHLAAALALVRGFSPERTLTTREIKPRIVQSELVVLEPKPQKAAAPKPKPKPMVTPQPVAPPKPQPKPQPAPTTAKPDPEKLKQEAERKRREERDRRLAELANQSFLEALESEDEQLQQVAQAADAAAQDVAAQSFRMGIYQAVVANWSRPPSARQGMEAQLLVELVPTGDVVSVSVLQSSGNGAFDRSAESAVNKAGRFEVPKDPELFERFFRKFTLLFRPEDLLR